LSDVPTAFVDVLRRLGFVSAGEGVSGTPLQGGVSSDIWRLRVGDRQVCAKRALARLKVEKEWLASQSRHVSEVMWLRQVSLFAPRSVPQILGHDPSSGIIVMEFLEPEDFPVWKSLLRQGDVRLDVIEAIAGLLVRVHAVTSRAAHLAERFDNDLFHQLRLTPYFFSLIDQHPDLGPVLTEMVGGIDQNRKAMTHGDFSPKNILIGPDGPVVLDAECAGWSDPAFDLAFCLNHLLLKSVWIPSAATGFRKGFERFSSVYLSGVDWEAPAELEMRAARLLAALLLARIDGKSPVEYIGCAADQEMVRGFARGLLLKPEATLDTFAARWFRHLSDHAYRRPPCNA
jgi:aminoglycoside phosphotransferase (APT) family kinase protein